MPAIAAFANPADPGNKPIQVFYNTNKANLALSLRSNGPNGSFEHIFNAPNENQEGLILPLSDLAALEHMGTQFVVGFTKGGTTENNISIVSPIHHPLLKVGLSDRSITACSNGDDAWIYYVENPDVARTRLKEFKFGNSIPNEQSSLKNISIGSHVASYCTAAGKRYVIYEGGSEEPELREYDVDKKDNSTIDDNANAGGNTPLAVTYVKDKKQVYLYYANTYRKLCRVIKDGEKWSASQLVSEAPRVDTASQLAVVTVNNINRIFYTPKGESIIGQVKDPCVYSA